jgi:hypothetical protein
MEPKENVDITAEALEMNAFLESYDPLEALEAEYRAVISQKIPENKENDEEEGEEDEYLEDEEPYSLVPSSPIGSDDEEEELEVLKEDQDKNVEKVVYKSIESDKKQLIMNKMRSFQLQPPSWAKEMEMSDAELVHMIQHRLSINTSNSSKPPAAA